MKKILSYISLYIFIVVSLIVPLIEISYGQLLVIASLLIVFIDYTVKRNKSIKNYFGVMFVLYNICYFMFLILRGVL